MDRREIIDNLWQKVEPVILDNDMEVVDIEWGHKNGRRTLCIYIDKISGVTIDDCEVISREISDLLDRIDVIDKSYVLEISSPGVNRPVKKIEDFRRFAGEFLKIRTEIPINGQKKFKGKVLELGENDTLLLIETEKGQELIIPFDKIEKANLWFHSGFTGNPKGGIKKK